MPLSARRLVVFSGVAFLVICGTYYFFVSAPQREAEPERFVVSKNTDESTAMSMLKDDGFVRSVTIEMFLLKIRGGRITPGGYKLSRSMNAWEIAGVFQQPPYMFWVTVPEGLRKEEVAELMGKELRWPQERAIKFINAQSDGYYFPDTYLIPLDESGRDVAKRMYDKFNERFLPLYPLFLKENIKNDTAIKIASLVQRESSGKNDMPLVAGIIWNRLLKNMKLDIDATLQYAQGKVGDSWWAPIHGPDARKLNSPYNTYMHTGLPPTPICSPGISAIEAVLGHAKTECLFYLHDKTGQIHCAKTLKEHEQNIQHYL